MAPEAELGNDEGASESDDPGRFFAIIPDPEDSSTELDTGDEDELALDPREEALQAWLEAAFAEGYGQYLIRIAPLLGRPPDPESGSSEALTRALPRLVIDVGADWRQETLAQAIELTPEQVVDTEEIVFDGDLMVTLLELYLYDGWQPIVAIEKELDRRLTRLRELRRKTPVAGSPTAWRREVDQLAPWEPAFFLFRLARNGIGQLVRDELAQIETRAGVRLESRIATAQTQFAALVGRLAWETIAEQAEIPVRRGESRTKEVVRHRLKDRELASTYQRALKDALLCRARLDRTLKELAAFESEVGDSKTKAASVRSGSTPYAKSVENSQEIYERFVADAQALAGVAENQLKINAPLLLLVLPTLRLGFDATEAWEEQLYLRVTAMSASLAELRADVRPQVPFTLQLEPPRIDISQRATVTALMSADPPVDQGIRGFEARMAELAVRGLSDGEPGWFPLASENTLHELVASNEIEKDSLTYVVYAHYVQTLGASLDQRLYDEQAAKRFWTNFSRFAAAASIASLFTPQTALAAPALRAAAGLADVVLLVQGVWSITSELQRLERLEHQALSEASSAYEALGRLGELVAIRQELLESLPREALLLLVTTLVGMTNFALTRRALVAYGLYRDLDTLVADDGPE